MTENDKLHKLFQTGVIIGRITQLCVDRGIVLSENNMGLSDFLSILLEEVGDLPVSEPLIKKILNEINNLMQNMSGYQKGFRIEPDDARIMIGFVSRWTDMLYDELLNGEKSKKTPAHDEKEEKPRRKRPVKQKPVSPTPTSEDNNPVTTKTPGDNEPQNPESSSSTPKNVKEKDPSS